MSPRDARRARGAAPRGARPGFSGRVVLVSLLLAGCTAPPSAPPAASPPPSAPSPPPRPSERAPETERAPTGGIDLTSPDEPPADDRAPDDAPDEIWPAPSFADPAALRALWDFDDPAASEARFRAAAEAQAPSEAALEHRTQVARALGLQRRFDEALAELDELDAFLDNAQAPLPRARVRAALERGRVLNSSGRANEARPLFIAAWERAQAAGLDGLAVDAAHMVAIVERNDAALWWTERALELAESSADPDARRWLGSLHNNLGWIRHDRGEHAQALAHFEAALAERLDAGDAADIRVARWCVARCLRSLGLVQAALVVQQDLLAEHAQAGTRDGFVHEEIAECLAALGRTDEARPHFRQAYEILSQDPWFVESEPARLEHLRAEGR